MTALDREDYSIYTPRGRRWGGGGEMESRDRSKENQRKKKKEEAVGMGWGRWGNKRTKLNTEKRDWKVFLQKETQSGIDIERQKSRGGK